MKKLLALICLLALTGCGGGEIEVEPFSYEETVSKYSGDSPGVARDGFKNTSQVEIKDAEDAIERSKNEVTVDYDSVMVSYDDSSDMWFVMYYSENKVGGNQDIYLDSNGVTQMIVYGE